MPTASEFLTREIIMNCKTHYFLRFGCIPTILDQDVLCCFEHNLIACGGKTTINDLFDFCVDDMCSYSKEAA